MTTASTVLNHLDALIAQRSILQHPFYRAWTMGALTREDLAVYARVYYPHVAAFPDYLRSAIASAQTQAEADATIQAHATIVKETLEDNLRDELSVPAPHTELWLRFADAVGADRDAVRAAAPTPGVANVTGTFTRLCESGSARALTALYAYESQQPAVSLEKISGLRQQYGIADASSLAYFTVHAESDIAHRDGERRALAACLDAGATGDEILDAASQALDAYWHLLDAVCAESRVAS
jgi:pyrroloquinoline-quinone synthase